MAYAKKTEPHPSKLPDLSKEGVIALEKLLREMVDSWAWLQFEEEEEQAKKRAWSSWMKRKPPKIQK